MNNQSQMVGALIESATKMHGFAYQHGHVVTIDDTNGIGTDTVNGINDFGRIVGFYSVGNTHGFLGTPKER